MVADETMKVKLGSLPLIYPIPVTLAGSIVLGIVNFFDSGI